MTDIGAELMKKVALDDQEAFKELIEHYEGMAFALLGRLLNSKEFAEDVAQEAFLRVWNNRQRYRAESKFSTYLYRILYNLALNKIRDNKRKQLFQFPVDESGEAIDLFDGKSHGTSHWDTHGNSYVISHGNSHGNFHGNSHGDSHGISQGTSHGG